MKAWLRQGFGGHDSPPLPPHNRAQCTAGHPRIAFKLHRLSGACHLRAPPYMDSSVRNVGRGVSLALPQAPAMVKITNGRIDNGATAPQADGQADRAVPAQASACAGSQKELLIAGGIVLLGFLLLGMKGALLGGAGYAVYKCMTAPQAPPTTGGQARATGGGGRGGRGGGGPRVMGIRDLPKAPPRA